MSDVLQRICDDKRLLVAARRAAKSQSVLEEQARTAETPRGFLRSLKQTAVSDRYALICEIKKASPSKGLIRKDFDPPSLARAYALGGAACLSVLTDEPYFQGADSYLQSARAAVDLPVLRKDFMLDPYQIVESRALGADCVLLIMAALSDAQAAELADCAQQWGMDVLIEVHDAAEMERALRLPSPLIGINNRNLKTLTVDLSTCELLAQLVPAERFLVSESGLNRPEDLARAYSAGARAFLIGESLMREADVAAATARLVAPQGAAMLAGR